MTLAIDSIPTAGADELTALAAHLQAEPAHQGVILTLTATGDPAAVDRGFTAALRGALESAVEPDPANLRHVWGDWPHDLFAALEPHIAAIAGRAVALFAWPDGRCDALATEVEMRPVCYYLVQPVSFPILEAAAALRPVAAVELHRQHAVIRQFQGARESASVVIHAEGRDPRQKTGSNALEHAERHDQKVEASYFAKVAGEVEGMSATARAVVVIGTDESRRRFLPHLSWAPAVGEVELNPDPERAALADAILAAAERAIGAHQSSALAAAEETARATSDWQVIARAARDGQLHEVWMDPGAALHSYICNHCGSLTEGVDDCRACQTSAWERLPLPEYVLREATRTGARVHFAIESAAAALGRGTGAVGVLRY